MHCTIFVGKIKTFYSRTQNLFGFQPFARHFDSKDCHLYHFCVQSQGKQSPLKRFKVVYRRKGFLWSPPISSGDNWEGTLDALKDEITEKFSDLNDADVDDLELMDEYECDIEDDEDLQDRYEEAEEDEILVRVRARGRRKKKTF